MLALASAGAVAAFGAAVIATETYSGEVEEAGGDYALVELEVPEGTVELEIRQATLPDESILDWGVWGPDGFRGWSGGLTDPIVIGEEAASRGYLAGPIEPGIWQLVIGKAKLQAPPVGYEAVVEYRDEATLAPRPRADYEGVTLSAEPGWYRGDFHVHSLESGDATASLEEIVALARERGLDFVVVTDHNTVSQVDRIAAVQAEVDDVLLIPGIEVTTYGGHGNALGVRDYVDHRIGLGGRDIGGVLADVAEQGGLFSINHPALALGDLCIGCPWGYEDVAWELVSAVEIHTGSYEFAGLFASHAIELWEEGLDRGYVVAAVGGSDDHRAGVDLSSTQSPIGSPTTLVRAEALSEEAILAAIDAGQTIVNFRGPDDPGLALEVEGGGARAGIGERLAAASVAVRATATDAEGYNLALYRNGRQIESVAAEGAAHEQEWTFDTRADGGDRYRAEIREGAVPLVVTSHVFADYAPPEPAGCGGCSTGAETGGALIVLTAGAVVVCDRRRRPRPRR